MSAASQMGSVRTAPAKREFQMFNNIVTRIEQTSDNGWFAYAQDEGGQVLASVTLGKQQILGKPVFVVDRYCVSPEVSPITGEAQAIGDLIDQAIAKLAAQQGIVSVLLVVPEQVRRLLPDDGLIYERKILTGSGGIPRLLPHFDGVTQSSATQFLN